MARKETNYAIGENRDRVYGIGDGAFRYDWGQRTLHQQGIYDNLANGNYNERENYNRIDTRERYPIGFNSGTQERYSEKGQSRIKPYEDAFSLTFCSRCRAIRQKNSLCTRCGGL